MSSIISGLNIKNISEYNTGLSYNKFDIIDYQLITGISVYPSYTGFGNTGLCSWFNNDNLDGQVVKCTRISAEVVVSTLSMALLTNAPFI